MEEKKILAVLAHPDDESFGLGGTLAYYASKGLEVHLICATKGEAGEFPSGFDMESTSIADIRESELRCAARVLGLKEIHFLNYRDSGMAGSEENKHPKALAVQPLDQVAAVISEKIQEIQPHVIITFDPIGGYRHPDHIAVHNATTRAFFLVIESQEKAQNKINSPKYLFYQTINRKLIKFFIRLLKISGRNPKKFGKNADIDIDAFANEEFPVHVEIDIRKYRKTKRIASQCHQSQGGGRFGGKLISILVDFFDRKEAYMQAYPPITEDYLIRNDFFTGE